MEGFAPPDGCPHLLPSSATSETATAQETEADLDESNDGTELEEEAGDEEAGIELPSGRALFLSEGYVVAEAHAARVVAILGEKDSGKTTLLAELYQQFLHGSCADHLFVQSRTLPGFEERCHLARIRSGNRRPDTERTKSGEIRLLHLAVRHRDLAAPTAHLLLTDMSGEFSRQIRSSAEDAGELLPLMKRADRVVLIVDGEQLAHPETRQKTVANSMIRFKALLEVGALGSTTPVDHVVSKWDCVVDADGGEVMAEQLEKETVERFAAQLGSLELHRIASRVERDVDVEPGEGLPGLLPGWTVARRRPVTYKAKPPPTAARSFVRYRFEPPPKDGEEE